ncbi:hypothetical protein [Hydrogenimonas sp.]
MREENFIAFWSVSGFFVGLIVAFFTRNDPLEILAIVAGTMLFFYLMAHVSIAFFVRFMEFGKVHFEKEAYDRKLDGFYNQLLQREAEIEVDHDFFSEGENNHIKEKKEGGKL